MAAVFVDMVYRDPSDVGQTDYYQNTYLNITTRFGPRTSPTMVGPSVKAGTAMTNVVMDDNYGTQRVPSPKVLSM